MSDADKNRNRNRERDANPNQQTLRYKAHRLLHSPTAALSSTKWLNRFLATLIIANVTAVAIETVAAIKAEYALALYVFEAVSTLIFLAEYLIRIWCAVEQPLYAKPFSGRLRWALRPVALLDLLVVVSYFAPVDLRFLRLIRLLRLLRVMNLESTARSYEHLKASIGARKELLYVSFVLMLIALFSSAALLYFCEHNAQPATFSSIPATLWWAVVTLTTIGYGDVYPITVAGIICAGFAAVFGIGVFALPTAILTSAVIEADGRSRACPYCGR